MSLVLSIGAALCWGVSDFCGGLAARRIPLLPVLIFSQGVGLLGMIGAALALGGQVRLGDLILGAIAGLAGAAGLAMLYASLARGVMAVISPLTGVVAAGIPVVVGVILLGERLSPAAVAGILFALVAVILLGGGPASAARPASGALALAVGAGLGFAVFYIALARTSAAAQLWPLVAARCASVGAMALFGVPTGRVRLPRDALGSLLIVVGGALDVTANALYVIAVHHGLLSVVSVIVSLYPGATVICALLLLGERLRALQVGGIVAALAAVVLIAA
jgi:drug/metabolite transporter (DMT)-like permease